MVGIAGAPSANAAKVSNAQIDASGKLEASAEGGDAGHPLAVFYGGNSGTCKSFSEDVITDAQQYGFNGEVKSLDSATEALPTDRPVVIITSSYEGQPPDNAKHFVAWLEANADKEDFLKGVRYAVCGVGNSEWYSTFHRIPKLINEIMSKLGAERIAPAGYVNVAEDIVGPFEDWKEHMFPKLREATGVQSVVKKQDIRISISKPEHHKVLAGQETSEGTVISNQVLAAKSEVNPEKRHMEIRLPAGTEYSTGDYIAILPFNPTHDAHRVLKRFALHPDDHIEISGTNKAHLVSCTASTIVSPVLTDTGRPAHQRVRLAHDKGGAGNARISAPNPAVGRSDRGTRQATSARACVRLSIQDRDPGETLLNHRPSGRLPLLQALLRRLPRHAQPSLSTAILHLLVATYMDARPRQVRLGAIAHSINYIRCP